MDWCLFAAAPDVSNYQYDDSSGFYYDQQSGLYYDPNSQVRTLLKLLAEQIYCKEVQVNVYPLLNKLLVCFKTVCKITYFRSMVSIEHVPTYVNEINDYIIFFIDVSQE